MAKILNKKELVVTSLLQRILQRFRQYYLSGGLFQEKVPSSVLEYLKTCDDPKEKFLLECRYGLNGGKKITIKQIAKTLGLSDSYISHRMAELLKKIGINEEEVVACEDIMRYISTSNNPKEILIAEHTYGLNGKPILSTVEISKEYGIPQSSVIQSLLRLRKKIMRMKAKEEYTDISEIRNIEQVIAYYNVCKNDTDRLILEHRYGLNGKEKKSYKEISEILNIKYKTLLNRLRTIVKQIKQINMDTPEK